MIGQRKSLNWSRGDLVDHANLFAARCLARPSPPGISRATAKEFGLVSEKGLNIVDGPTAAEVRTLSEHSVNIQ
jgi:hypothetical protein